MYLVKMNTTVVLYTKGTTGRSLGPSFLSRIKRKTDLPVGGCPSYHNDRVNGAKTDDNRFPYQ